MAYLKPIKMKERKKPKNYKKVLPLFIVAIMVGSGLIAFTYSTGVDKATLRIVTVDPLLGSSDDLYNGEVDIQENLTVVQMIRNAGLSVRFENSTFVCIGSMCNDGQRWEFYVNGLLPLEPADSLWVEKDDQILLVFR